MNNLNNLNSILVEGKLPSDPQVSDGKTLFYVLSVHYDKAQFHETLIPVKTTGNLASVCADYLKAGRVVRVVGRLAQDNTELYVHAEHVEFKPVREQKEQKA